MKKLALVGLGTVGIGVYEQLNAGSDDYHIKHVVVKDPTKKRDLKGELPAFSTIQEVLDDEEVEIIIEVINDENEALSIANSSLNRGKTLISASKKMLAANLDNLQQICLRTGAELHYEAAVCGSIPIITLLQNFYNGNKVTCIRTIANGTANYIFDSLFNSKDSFKQALEKAQKLGFAETDAADDIEGYDTTSKLSLLIANAFQKIVLPKEIPTIGLSNVNIETIQFLKEYDLKLKLIGEAYLKDNHLTAFTIPQIINSEDSLFHVHAEHNIVEVNNLLSEKQQFQAKGAGRLPTTQSVLADLYALNSRRKNLISYQTIDNYLESLEIFYVSHQLSKPEFGSIKVLKEAENYSFIYSNWQQLIAFKDQHPTYFIAKVSTEVYHDNFI